MQLDSNFARRASRRSVYRRERLRRIYPMCHAIGAAEGPKAVVYDGVFAHLNIANATSEKTEVAVCVRKRQRSRNVSRNEPEGCA